MGLADDAQRAVRTARCRQVSENFLPVMKTELSTFFPYNLVAFSLIPPLVRPFSTGLLSMCFSIYISLTTHSEPSAPLVVAAAEGCEASLLGLRRSEASNTHGLRSGEASSDEASLDVGLSFVPSMPSMVSERFRIMD